MNNFENYKNKGLSGLTNLGNTCFLNSTMLILSHTYELNNFLNMKTYKNKLNKNNDAIILIEWDNLRNLLWKENCVISPYKFLNTLKQLAEIKGNDNFIRNDENDLSE